LAAANTARRHALPGTPLLALAGRLFGTHGAGRAALRSRASNRCQQGLERLDQHAHDPRARVFHHPPGATEAELKICTLTNLYNQRPTWLINAHAQLDAAVFAAYGWPPDLAGEQIISRLPELKHSREPA
jgi:hypothetical protein